MEIKKTKPIEQKKEESWNSTVKQNLEFGCIPLEIISDLTIDKHWKIKLKSLNEIE